MRSYGQYCAVAKALDAVGDRWTLLIVRELLLAGPSRYTDLRNGLPGIATNLLADRLRELEQTGIVRSEAAPPPVATTLYSLTERGAALEAIVLELGRWGSPLMVAGPAEGDDFRSHWLSFPASEYLTDTAPDGPAASIELRTGAEPVTIDVHDGALELKQGAAEDPDLILSAPPHVLLGVITGQLDLAAARSRGLKAQGDHGVLERVRPAAARG